METAQIAKVDVMNIKLINLIQQIYLLRYELQNELNEILKRHDLTVSQWLVLQTIESKKDGVTITALKANQGIQMSSVTKAVKHLRSRSFVYRTDNPEDERSVIVGITPSGREFLKDVQKELVSNQSNLEQIIADRRWKEISTYLSS